MKVLTITNMLPISGAKYYGIFVKEQIDGLNKYFPEIENKIYFINGRRSKLNYIISIFRINFLLIFKKFDLIHIHFGLSGIFLLFNPIIKAPIIITIHGSDFNNNSKKYKMLINAILRRCDSIIYLNKQMKYYFNKFNKNLHYIPCGVNTDIFSPQNRILKNSIRIAFPASKDRPEKNFKFFETIINNLKIDLNKSIEIVEIHNMNRIEVRDTLNSSDLLCMTSLHEGSPQIIKEAMACNTPIVTSNVGDVSVLLDGVLNCVVINGFNKIDYINAIKKTLSIPSESRISNGRDKIFEMNLDEKGTSQKLHKLYQDLILDSSENFSQYK